MSPERDNARESHIAPGRFVVHLRGATVSGLDAAAAIALIDRERDDVTELFVIHRVLPDGGMELAGITAESLRKQDCMMFSRREVAAARRDYDALVAYAAATPPPCRIDLRFGHAKSLEPSYLVILIYPNACQSAVGMWLSAAPFNPGDFADGSPHVLAAFEAASPQIILSTTLEA